jgi:hypothetical protein
MLTLENYRIQKKNVQCNLIIIDNFYDDPYEVRKIALHEEYNSKKYYPGMRSKSFASIDIKNKIQSYIETFAGKIIEFPLYKCDNGSFQYATSNDRTWIHTDSENMNWGGIVFLTPDAPIKSGTTFYKYCNGIMNNEERILTNTEYKSSCRDNSKWEIVDQVGNIFNRLILFNSARFHASTEYFGDNIHNSRLFQVFFFKTQY